MLLNILRAIHKMMDGEPSKDTIKCAREVLGELIAHIEEEAQPKIVTRIVRTSDLDPEAQQAQEEILGE